MSISTVGMILNGRGDRYSAETRRKVLEAAEEVDYRPNISARGLRLNRTYLIGVSVFAANNTILSSLIRGVQDGLTGSRCSFLFYTHATQAEELDFLLSCKERQVDGMIINPGFYANGSADTSSAYLELYGRDVPVVEVFGRAVPEAPSVNIDNFEAGRVATNHLISLGHRRIGMLTHDQFDECRETGMGKFHPIWNRYRGYEQTMIAAGLTPVHFAHRTSGELDDGWNRVSGGFNALKDVMSHPSQPTAIVCGFDYEAMGLMQAAKLHGVTVPDQLSVVGYGEIGAARLVTPALTTFSMPAFEVGRCAATSLLGLIDKQSFEDVLIPATFQPRQSTAAPNSSDDKNEHSTDAGSEMRRPS